MEHNPKPCLICKGLMILALFKVFGLIAWLSVK